MQHRKPLPKRIKLGLLAVALTLVGTFGVLTPQVYADEWNTICDDPSLTDLQREAAGCSISSDAAEGMATSRIGSIIKVAIGVIALVAVIVIVVAGILMMTANGDAGKVAKARQAIIFALVGLLIALLAFAIVNFAIDGLSGSAGGGSGSGGSGGASEATVVESDSRPSDYSDMPAGGPVEAER